MIRAACMRPNGCDTLGRLAGNFWIRFLGVKIISRFCFTTTDFSGAAFSKTSGAMPGRDSGRWEKWNVAKLPHPRGQKRCFALVGDASAPPIEGRGAYSGWLIGEDQERGIEQLCR